MKTYLTLNKMFDNDECYQLLTNMCQNPNTRTLFSHATMYKSGISKDAKDPDVLFFIMKLMLKKYEQSKFLSVPTTDEIKEICTKVKNSLEVEHKAHEYLVQNGIQEDKIPQSIANMLNNMLNVSLNCLYLVWNSS